MSKTSERIRESFSASTRYLTDEFVRELKCVMREKAREAVDRWWKDNGRDEAFNAAKAMSAEVIQEARESAKKWLTSDAGKMVISGIAARANEAIDGALEELRERVLNPNRE